MSIKGLKADTIIIDDMLDTLKPSKEFNDWVFDNMQNNEDWVCCYNCKYYNKETNKCKTYDIIIKDEFKRTWQIKQCDDFEEKGNTESKIEVPKTEELTLVNKKDVINLGKLVIQKSITPKKYQEYIPNIENYVVDNKLITKILYGMSLNEAIVLEGHTGVGKTEAVRYVASLLKTPYIYIQFTEMKISDSIIGFERPIEGKLEWWDGLLTHYIREAIKYPKAKFILCLDEWNAASKEVQMDTRSLLDMRKDIQLLNKKYEKLSLPKNLYIFATMNPDEYTNLYQGVFPLNQADKNRFGFWIWMDFPQPSLELEIIKSHYPEVSNKLAKQLTTFASQLRKSLQDGDINLVVGTRSVLNVVKYLKLGLKTAIDLAILNKMDEQSKKAAHKVINYVFGDLV